MKLIRNEKGIALVMVLIFSNDRACDCIGDAFVC